MIFKLSLVRINGILVKLNFGGKLQERSLKNHYKMNKILRFFLIQLPFYIAVLPIILNWGIKTAATDKEPLPSMNIPGEWGYYKGALAFCNEPEVARNYPECDASYKLLEINFWDSYTQALQVFNDPTTIKFLLAHIDPPVDEKTIIKIYTPDNCGILFLNHAALSDKGLTLVNQDRSSACRETKSLFGSTYTLNLSEEFLDKYNSYALYRRLGDLEVVKDFDLAIAKEGENIYHLYSKNARRNLLLSGNFWELLSIRIVIERQEKTAFFAIESFYQSGINPPQTTSFLPGTAEQASLKRAFFLSLKGELLE